MDENERLRYMMKHIITTIILLLFSQVADAVPAYSQNYLKWKDYPLDFLFDKGLEYKKYNETPDSSVVCFSIIKGRYNKDLSIKDKELCCRACIENFKIYFVEYSNYAEAYNYLLTASTIRDDIKIDLPEIDFYFGVFYQSIVKKDNTIREKAISFYRKAFHSAVKKGDPDVYSPSLSNMLLLMKNMGDISGISKEFEMYRNIHDSSDSFRHKYNLLLHSYCNNYISDRMPEAYDVASDMLDFVTGTESNGMYVSITYSLIADVLIKTGRYAEAIEVLKSSEDSEMLEGEKDALVRTAMSISQCYGKLGNYKNAYERLMQYTLLQDSLYDAKQMSDIFSMPFIHKIRKMDTEIMTINHNRTVLMIWFGVAVIIMLIIGLAMIAVCHKNKQLKNANRILYEHNRELLNSEDRQMECLRENVLKNEEKEKTSDEKYKNSKLSDELKEELANKILCIMQNVDEICSPEFSVNKLAELTDSREKYVSQVINEKFDMNFNAFINKYRVRVACKRLSDMENYGQYTIASISESVGFKSRSSFVASFKKETGLTPNMYQKIAKEQQNS